jgi:hypothetical protein
MVESLPPGAGDSETMLPALLADSASLYSIRTLYADAQRNYARSLELYRKMHGEVHPDVARVMGMIAINSLDLGHPNEALHADASRARDAAQALHQGSSRHRAHTVDHGRDRTHPR